MCIYVAMHIVCYSAHNVFSADKFDERFSHRTADSRRTGRIATKSEDEEESSTHPIGPLAGSIFFLCFCFSLFLFFACLCAGRFVSFKVCEASAAIWLQWPWWAGVPSDVFAEQGRSQGAMVWDCRKGGTRHFSNADWLAIFQWKILWWTANA